MFEKIFKGLERAHGCTKVTSPAENGVKLKGQSFVVRQPVTEELWKMHLDGTQSLGIIPINEDNQCVWGCVDIDSYAGFDHKKLIDKIKQYIKSVILFLYYLYHPALALSKFQKKFPSIYFRR